jgi:hypothetical protein
MTITLTEMLTGHPVVVESERVDSVTDQPTWGGLTDSFITFYPPGSQYLVGVHVRQSAHEIAPLLGFNSPCPCCQE